MATPSLGEVSKMAGISDITPIQAKARFGQAYLAELSGDHALAEQKLIEACQVSDR